MESTEVNITSRHQPATPHFKKFFPVSRRYAVIFMKHSMHRQAGFLFIHILFRPDTALQNVLTAQAARSAIPSAAATSVWSTTIEQSSERTKHSTIGPATCTSLGIPELKMP